MNTFKLVFLSFLLTFTLFTAAYSLPMGNRVVENFKKAIVDCSSDALELKGEFKNHSYYVYLKEGLVRGHAFQNVIVKFAGLSSKARESFLKEGVNFSQLQKTCKIKFAGDISPDEFQQIIDREILHSSKSRRIFNEAIFTFENNSVVVEGKINLKRVPGNPFVMMSPDTFSTFNARITASISGTEICLSIIEGNVNGQEMTEELKNMFLSWLNPIWDFSKLGFPCGISEYKISPSGLRIDGYVF